MKKVMKSLSVMLLMVALGMSFGSCGGDSDNLALLLATAGTGTVSPADPEGTVVVNIGPNSEESLSNINVWLRFTYEGNLYVSGDEQIVSVGPVAGLGFINTNAYAIPQEGWNTKVAAQVGNGYIIKKTNGSYINFLRVYIVGYNDAGGITIKYQLWDGIPQ